MIINENGTIREATQEEINSQKEKMNSPKYLKQIKSLEISKLKNQLKDTDYKAIKYAEGWISEEEYSEIKAERQALRDKINELEQELSQI